MDQKEHDYAKMQLKKAIIEAVKAVQSEEKLRIIYKFIRRYLSQ